MSGYVRCHFQAQANCEDWDDAHEPTGELAEENGRGKRTQNFEASWRLPGLSYTGTAKNGWQCVMI